MALTDALNRSAVRLPLVLLLGVVHAFTFVPLAHWWLQGAVLVVLATVLGHQCLRAGRVRALATTGWAFGMGWFTCGLYWLTISMNQYGGMPAPLAWAALVLFAAYLSLFPALGAALAAWGWRRRGWTGFVAGLTAGMTLSELARGWLFSGFPWLSPGYGQLDGPLTGFAPLGGVYLVGFALWLMVSSLAACLSVARHAGEHRRLGLILLATATGAIGAVALTGTWTEPKGDPISVRLVQANIPQDVKFDPVEALRAMTRHVDLATAEPAALVLLPETAWTIPFSQTPQNLVERLRQYVNGHRATVALGAPTWTSPSGPAEAAIPGNSVIALDRRSLNSATPVGYTYDKSHLVPFGEFVPWGFRWFVSMMHIPLGTFRAGDPVQSPLTVAGQRIGFNICYEDLFGEELVRSIRPDDGPTILANVSNIAWFGQSWAPEQHLAIARMRAVEAARPMVRATNTGATASIDFDGKVLASVPAFEEGAVNATVQGRTGRTPYAASGNTPVLVLAMVLLLCGLFRPRPGVPPAAPGPDRPE